MWHQLKQLKIQVKIKIRIVVWLHREELLIKDTNNYHLVIMEEYNHLIFQVINQLIWSILLFHNREAILNNHHRFILVLVLHRLKLEVTQLKMQTEIHLWVRPTSCNLVWTQSLHLMLMVLLKSRSRYKTRYLKFLNNKLLITKDLTRKSNWFKHISNILRD